MTVTCVEAVMPPPPSAFTVMVYVLDGVEVVVEMVRVELCIPPYPNEMEAGLRDVAGPFPTEGETGAVRETVPEYP
jgi:hypothetical protein